MVHDTAEGIKELYESHEFKSGDPSGLFDSWGAGVVKVIYFCELQHITWQLSFYCTQSTWGGENVTSLEKFGKGSSSLPGHAGNVASFGKFGESFMLFSQGMLDLKCLGAPALRYFGLDLGLRKIFVSACEF